MGGKIKEDKIVVKSVISKDLRNQLQKIADSENRTLSNLINLILTRYVEENYSDTKLREAIKDINKQVSFISEFPTHCIVKQRVKDDAK